MLDLTNNETSTGTTIIKLDNASKSRIEFMATISDLTTGPNLTSSYLPVRLGAKQSVDNRNTSDCNTIIENNPTFALVKGWKNIPETLLLNICISVCFYITFRILTNRAWSKKSLRQEFVENGWIQFLFGYRDPERWVALPRFEFMHRSKRHHQHEPNYPYLYISPRLVAYDPNSILRKGTASTTEDGPQNMAQSGVMGRASSQLTWDSASQIRRAPNKQWAVGQESTSQDNSLEDAPKQAIDGKLGLDLGKAVGKIQTKRAATNSNLGAAVMVSSSKEVAYASLRSKPAFLVKRSAQRGHLNLPYSQDPLLNPQLAARMEGTGSIQAQAINKTIGTSGAKPRIASVYMSQIELPETPMQKKVMDELDNEVSKRSKLSASGEEIKDEDIHVIIDHLGRANWLTRNINRFFEAFSNITDIDLIYCKGIDAYEYLLFERYMILLMAIINLICMGVILPIHLNGTGLKESQEAFYKTTITNVPKVSLIYWVHIMASISITIIAIYLLGSYKASTITKNDVLVSRRTLLIGRLGDELRNKERLYTVLQETFPNCHVEAIQFVYDTTELEQLQQNLESVIVAREYCDLYRKKYKQSFMVQPTGVNEAGVCRGYCRICSCCLVCLCYWPMENQVDGSSYYSHKELTYRKDIQNECRRLVKSPHDAVFVTFKSHKQARRVYNCLASKFNNLPELLNPNSKLLEYSVSSNKRAKTGAHLEEETISMRVTPSQRNATGSKSNSKEAKQNSINNNQRQQVETEPSIGHNRGTGNEPMININSKTVERFKQLTVRYAPHPDNVEYQTLVQNTAAGILTQILLNLLIFVIFLFLSTPTVLFTYLVQLQATQMAPTFLDSPLAQYLLVLLQILAAVVLPTMIMLISQNIPYEDSASKNHAILWKVFLFLILMVIVLPSFGLSTSTALLTRLLNKDLFGNISPQCIFPIDNGAFFINYVISSCFLTTSELLKMPDLSMYLFFIITNRSKADFETARQFINKEFTIGIQYTKFLLIVAIVLSYTISCPLIAPFGLLYMIFKYYIDKYNIYYAYYTSKVDKQTQRTVEIFIRLSILLMLLQITITISTYSQDSNYFPLISQIVFWFSVATFAYNCFFEFTSHTVLWDKKIRYQREFCACFYLPPVFEDLLKENALPSDCTSFKT